MAMSEALSNQEVQAAWAKLAEEARTGVLLTLRNGWPFGSHVPYVFGEHWTRAYIHVSRLALHTGHLLQDARVGLFISEPDRPEKNPLALRRMNLQGEAVLLNAGAPNYAEVKERYLARCPQSAMMVGLRTSHSGNCGSRTRIWSWDSGRPTLPTRLILSCGHIKSLSIRGVRRKT